MFRVVINPCSFLMPLSKQTPLRALFFLSLRQIFKLKGIFMVFSWKRFVGYIFLVNLLVVFGSYSLDSQNNEDWPEVTLESPNNAVYTHLFYQQRDSYDPELAAASMPPVLDQEERVVLARQLLQVYDGKGLYVFVDKVPTEPAYADSLGQHIFFPFPNQLPGLFLERIDSLWYYSHESISEIRIEHSRLYPFGADIWINLLPFGLDVEILGLQVWQITAAIILLIVIWLLHFLLSRFFRPIVSNFMIKRIQIFQVDPRLIKQVSRVISLLIVLYVLKLFIPSLLLPITIGEFLVKSLGIAHAVFIGVLIYRFVQLFSAYLKMLSEKTTSKLDKQVLPIIDKSLKFFVILGVLFHVLSLLDVNVTALLAGISIGGLALALAAQDTVKNFIGSLMIFIDKPFEVGDFIGVGSYFGSVVEVGFRSTRLMLINTSIVTIPNGRLSDMDVTNLGKRQFRMLETKIALTYDTPPSRIETFIKGLKQLILDHPKFVKERYVVNFFEMADYSLNVFIRAFIDVPDYATELRVKEEYYLSVMRLAASVGVRFAFPSTTMYIEEFPEKKSLIPEYSKPADQVENEMTAFLMKNSELMEKLREEYNEIERQAELDRLAAEEN